MDIVPLFKGFPARSDRGYLGWSSCVLLEGERKLLFDTVGYGERTELLAALAKRGLEPGAIAGVFLSHFHFDHAVNYRLFPRATLYLHERELVYARSEHERDLAIPIELLADLEASGRLELLRGEEGRVGTIDWFLAPGHTAGLYALRIRQGDTTIVLASDAVKNIGEATRGESAVAWDLDASRRTIRSILAQADVIVPGHDRLVRVRRDPATGAVRLEPEASTAVRIMLADEVPASIREWTVELG